MLRGVVVSNRLGRIGDRCRVSELFIYLFFEFYNSFFVLYFLYIFFIFSLDAEDEEGRVKRVVSGEIKDIQAGTGNPLPRTHAPCPDRKGRGLRRGMKADVPGACWMLC
jgi:hypothetical protein